MILQLLLYPCITGCELPVGLLKLLGQPGMGFHRSSFIGIRKIKAFEMHGSIGRIHPAHLIPDTKVDTPDVLFVGMTAIEH